MSATARRNLLPIAGLVSVCECSFLLLHASLRLILSCFLFVLTSFVQVESAVHHLRLLCTPPAAFFGVQFDLFRDVLKFEGLDPSSSSVSSLHSTYNPAVARDVLFS